MRFTSVVGGEQKRVDRDAPLPSGGIVGELRMASNPGRSSDCAFLLARLTRKFPTCTQYSSGKHDFCQGTHS